MLWCYLSGRILLLGAEFSAEYSRWRRAGRPMETRVVFPGGVVGWDWLWIGLAVVSDILWYTGAAARKRVPGYSGQY